MMRVVLSCVLLFATITSTAPVAHVSGGEEHIVILDKSQPTPPKVAEILARLDLHEEHSDVRYIFNNSAFIGFVSHLECGTWFGLYSDFSETGGFDEVSLLRSTGKHDRGLHRRASSDLEQCQDEF